MIILWFFFKWKNIYVFFLNIFFYDSEGRALPGPSSPDIISFIINSIINKSKMKND